MELCLSLRAAAWVYFCHSSFCISLVSLFSCLVKSYLSVASVECGLGLTSVKLLHSCRHCANEAPSKTS